MSEKTVIREVKDIVLDVVSLKTRDIKLRELCDRIYYLLHRCMLPSGKSLVTLLGEVHDSYDQSIFEMIYQHVRQRYFQSLGQLNRKGAKPYILEEENEFFLAGVHSLREVLALFSIHENYKEIPTFLRKKISPRIIQSLFGEEVPRLRILYAHRHNPSLYKSNVVETVELLEYHFDKEPIPPFIKHIYVHRIYQLKGYAVKIWEIIPSQLIHEAPVCLVPGFSTNYYTFHCEGNNSLDYHLAKQGSRVFVLDHDWGEQDANMDIYAEYLLSTLIDVARRRSQQRQVILAGHGLGGTLIIFKQVLNAIQYSKFIDPLKAVVLINPPLDFSSLSFMSQWKARFLEKIVAMTSKNGTVPIGKIASVVTHLPGLTHLLTFNAKTDTPLLEWAESNHLPVTHSSLKLNPFSVNPKLIRTLFKYGVVNPPKMAILHLLKMLKSGVEGAVSFNYEEIYISAGEDVYVEQDQESQEQTRKQTIGLSYTDNLYRVAGSVPVLTLQTENDIFSLPETFFPYWKRWPNQHKMKLDSYPSDFVNQQDNLAKIKRYIEDFRLSTSIHVTVHEGRHLDALFTQKRVVAAFIEAVNRLDGSPVEILKTEIEVFRAAMDQNYTLEQKMTLTKDMARKVRFLDQQSCVGKTQEIVEVLMKILQSHIPLPGYETSYYDLMVREEQSDENEELKENLFFCCITAIVSLKPDSETVLAQILEIVKNPKITLLPQCYRSLIDLALALYDHGKNYEEVTSKRFLKKLEQLLNFSVKHPESRVALHAVRGFFHTRNSDFIKKGIQIYKKLPLEWQEKTTTIYWNEIHKLILEEQAEHAEEILPSMVSFMQYYDEFVP
ncbi:hypothetical protein WDW89_24725 [Deltaproteobacteria bacterium TL4]